MFDMIRGVLAGRSSACQHEGEVEKLRALCGEANRMIRDHVRDRDEEELQYRLASAAEGREA
jgi:hypothetical protein